MKKTIHKVLLIHIPLFLLIGLFHIKLLIIDKTLDPKPRNTDIVINVDNISND